jgi:hypothetical protein
VVAIIRREPTNRSAGKQGGCHSQPEVWHGVGWRVRGRARVCAYVQVAPGHGIRPRQCKWSYKGARLSAKPDGVSQLHACTAHVLVRACGAQAQFSASRILGVMILASGCVSTAERAAAGRLASSEARDANAACPVMRCDAYTVCAAGSCGRTRGKPAPVAYRVRAACRARGGFRRDGTRAPPGDA